MDSRIRKNRIITMLEKYNKKLLKYYLNHGPAELKKKLDVENEEIWKIIFDYLMFEKDAVKICVKKNSEYIRDIFIKKGPKALRKSFYLDSPEYNDIWQYIMDYIGIASGALYAHVNKEASHYQDLIRNGKATQIRKSLELEKHKYDSVWEDVLDVLLECISFTNFTHCQFEQGIRFFTNLYNRGRKHRSLNPREVES